MAIGLDFGTTNSALALALPGGEAALVSLNARSDAAALRSLLFFDAEERDSRRRPRADIGEDAIDAVLDPYREGRFIQSVKSYLANAAFSSTQIFGKKFTIADLVSVLLAAIRARAFAHGANLGGAVVVGRPAKYVGEAEDVLALERMSEALNLAGYGKCEFAYEPLAAAYAYEQRLDHDELVLIGDFGGGTSDFCLLRVGPSRLKNRQAAAILAVDGLGKAGDALDARLVEQLVAPALGQGQTYTAPSGKQLPVPAWLYEHLRDWHKLSFLDTPNTRSVLKELRQGSDHPQAFAGLEVLITERLGFHLSRAVEATKIALSGAAEARFEFEVGSVKIDQLVSRENFERWIEPEIAAIGQAIDRTLSSAGIGPGEIDAVFLTGGTAFVPAVRRAFSERFGAEKLKGGGELVSVATGLALMAAERELGH